MMHNPTTPNIYRCRDLNLRAACEYARHGVAIPDIAMAALFSAIELATAAQANDHGAAIEWLRNGIDVVERELLGDGNADG